MRNIIVSPSILSTDFIKLKNTIDIINKSESEWVHIDVMDGVFVPNISFGFPILKSIRDNTDKKLDVHLMIVNPDNYIDEFTKHGADIVTVHYEACNHLNRTLNKIKTNGVLSGVALNPHTSVNLLKDVIDDLDVVLVMSVNPGYGGQKFIKNTYNKILSLVDMRKTTTNKFLIEVDGGVNLDNSSELIKNGVDVLVAGNSVFSSDDPIETIKKLRI